MSITARSFAKINLGLAIGPKRADGFHELRTVYQTVALNDVIRVSVTRGSGIEIRCADSRVPKDDSNTCHRILDLALAALKARGRVIVEIEKRLPVQGGLGGASGNAVAALVALERALKKWLPDSEKLRIATEVGSDVPLFLIGGTVLGVDCGQEVYPLPDLPVTPCAIATPDIGVSTPKAFADWDCGAGAPARQAPLSAPELTPKVASDRLLTFSRKLSAWLSSQANSGRASSGVPGKRRGRAGTPLLDLVRTGIENDFEQVVFPQYPELHEVKRVLALAGASYASLSGSGSAVYGLFGSPEKARRAAAKLVKMGIPATATFSLPRRQYWRKFLVAGS